MRPRRMQVITVRSTLLAAHLAIVATLGAAACGGDGASHESSSQTGDDASTGRDAAGDASTEGAAPVAESGTGDGGGEAGVHDGSAPDGGDSGKPDASHDGGDGGFVSASHPRMPLVVNQGGTLVAAPHFTSVTFASTYANAVTDLDTFVGEIGSQPYWAATTSEYGVAAPVVEAPQHLAEAAPATIADADIKTWLAGKIQGGAPGFAGATADSVFVLFYPSTTSISQTATSKSCTQFGGYHGSAQVTVNGQSILVPYAVIPECPDAPDAGSTHTTLQKTTAATGHELVELCTDPYVDRSDTTTLAWVGTAPLNATTDPYAAWPIGILGDYADLETGDMCESFGSSWFTPSSFPYMVQRTWSNAAVKAGKDPCAPYHTGEAAYFLAQPVFDPDFAKNEAQTPPVYLPSVDFTVQGAIVTTQGIKIPVGQSATIPLVLWSDAPVAQPWTVYAFDPSTEFGNATPYLTFTLDKTSGNNGDTIHLTIHVNAANPNFGGEAFGVTSTDGVLKHSTYGFVTN